MNQVMKTAVCIVILSVLATACGGGDDDGTDAGSPFGFGESDSGSDLPVDVDEAVAEILEGTDVGDMLDAIEEGEDVEDMMGDLMENAEAMAEAFGDAGSGTVTVEGETISFTSEICFAGQGDFSIDGLGTASDGTPVWVSISHSDDSRAELLEVMDESMVEMLYGDAERIIDSSVSIDFGRDELFGDAPDDQPSFNATSSQFAGEAVVELVVNGDSVSGSGMATDYNYVAGDWDTFFPVEVQASCG